MTKAINEDFGTERDGAYDKLKSSQEHSGKAKAMLAGAGYARGGGVSPIRAKKIADKEVHKHEKHDHPGKKKTRLKHGGKIEGKKAHERADKFARGGRAPKGEHTKVNINLGASQADKAEALKKGVMLGTSMAAQRLSNGAPKPPMGPMPSPGPSGPMAPSAGAPMPQKRGGRTYATGGKVGPKKVEGVPHLSGGSGGALGRREKIKQYGTKPKA